MGAEICEVDFIRPVNETAVERLERALELAKSGEAVSVAIAMVRPDGAATTMHSRSSNVATLLGAIAILNTRVLRGALED